MKGVIVIGLVDGEAMHICYSCWHGGCKVLYDTTIQTLEEHSLPASFELMESSISHCDICKRAKRDLN